MPGAYLNPLDWLVAVEFLLIPLVATVVVELLVALPFRVGRRGLAAVVLVNGVTNPLLNLFLLTVYGLGIGFKWVPFSNERAVVWYVIFFVAEAVVVLVEWRLLNWVLRKYVSSRRLLVLAVAMNVVSAGLGLLLQQ
jgi:hypothetical protein